MNWKQRVIKFADVESPALRFEKQAHWMTPRRAMSRRALTAMTVISHLNLIKAGVVLRKIHSAFIAFTFLQPGCSAFRFFKGWCTGTRVPRGWTQLQIHPGVQLMQLHLGDVLTKILTDSGVPTKVGIKCRKLAYLLSRSIRQIL